MKSCKHTRVRTQKGASLIEFAAAIALFICVVLIPFVNMGFVPVRYMLCETILANLALRLSHCEKLSDAYTMLLGDQYWKTTLNKFGVDVSGEEIVMLATTGDGSQKYSVKEGQSWPKEWLPSGANGPYLYSLTVHCQCSINPFFRGDTLPALAGITRPVNFEVSGGSQWENLSRDPKSATLAYFMEE
jgi:hypothetical protein